MCMGAGGGGLVHIVHPCQWTFAPHSASASASAYCTPLSMDFYTALLQVLWCQWCACYTMNVGYCMNIEYEPVIEYQLHICCFFIIGILYSAYCLSMPWLYISGILGFYINNIFRETQGTPGLHSYIYGMGPFIWYMVWGHFNPYLNCLLLHRAHISHHTRGSIIAHSTLQIVVCFAFGMITAAHHCTMDGPMKIGSTDLAFDSYFPLSTCCLTD